MNDSSKIIKERMLIFVKWIVISTALGLVVGVVGSAFHKLLDYVTELRTQTAWVLYLLPIAGCVIVFLYRISHREGLNTDLVLLAVRTNEEVPLRLTPLIFVSTIITHLFGGSAGREGAALQIGGSIGQYLGRLLKLDCKNLRIITMCGMSACFSAVFGTPIAAAIFAIEVVSVGVMYYAALVPCTIAAMVSFLVSHACNIEHEWVQKAFVGEISPSMIFKTVLLGILCAAVSFAFCKLLSNTTNAAKRFIKNEYLRTLMGAVLIVALTLILGTRDYLGAGMDVISDALSGTVRPEAFILKMIFTAITIAAAFKGGEIVPTFFIGATFGAAIAPVLGLDAGLSAMLSMVAVFCGVTNCPIASIIIGFELFGMDNAPLFLIACAVSYMLSGYSGLYGKQKILYSKYSPEFINGNVIH